MHSLPQRTVLQAVLHPARLVAAIYGVTQPQAEELFKPRPMETDQELFERLFGERLEEGDEKSVRVFTQAAAMLGRVLAAILTQIDPEVLALSGFLARAGDHVRVRVKNECHRSDAEIVTAASIMYDRACRGRLPSDDQISVDRLPYEWRVNAGAAHIAAEQHVRPRVRDYATQWSASGRERSHP